MVDGPPRETGPNARFPALLHLLNMLPKAIFHRAIDEYRQDEEKKVLELGLRFCESGA